MQGNTIKLRTLVLNGLIQLCLFTDISLLLLWLAWGGIQEN